jgi:hypothetical protein
MDALFLAVFSFDTMLDAFSKVSTETVMNMHGHVTAFDGHKRRYTDACLRLLNTLRYLAG